MKPLTLVYGLRLVPPNELKSTHSGEAILKNGSVKRVTLHTLEGSVEEIRAQLERSLEAFFELLPSEYEEKKRTGEDFSEI